MAAEDDITDRMTRLLDELWALPESELGGALEEAMAKLTPEEREVARKLARQRAAHLEEQAEADAEAETFQWIGDVDQSELLMTGRVGLENLWKITEPAELLAVLDRTAKEQRRALVAMLFCARVFEDLPPPDEAFGEYHRRLRAEHEAKPGEDA